MRVFFLFVFLKVQKPVLKLTRRPGRFSVSLDEKSSINIFDRIVEPLGINALSLFVSSFHHVKTMTVDPVMFQFV